MVPTGLGFLLSNGYVGDVGSFFCPSSVGMPVRVFGNDTYKCYASTELRDYQTVGGRDWKSVAYGDWSWLSMWEAGYLGTYNVRAALSHYDYRLKPTWAKPATAYYTAGASLADDHWSKRVRVLYTKPERWVNIGEPVFKTQKQLGGRALVTDAYGRDTYSDHGGTPTPGFGYYGHREGYNVLYGDWSAKWFGDPQRRIMWLYPRTEGEVWFQSTRLYYATTYNATLNDYYAPGGTGAAVADGDYPYRRGHTFVGIWHVFDLANGIDVGVDETYWK